jgi:ATP-dependent RNA helicase DeaD
VADLRARQLDITRAALRERLVAGNLDYVRVVIESLSEEFDIVETRECRRAPGPTSRRLGAGNDREIPVIDMSRKPEKRALDKSSATVG